jgi:hypothetical protein
VKELNDLISDALPRMGKNEEYLVAAVEDLTRRVTIQQGDVILDGVVVERHVINDIRVTYSLMQRIFSMLPAVVK